MIWYSYLFKNFSQFVVIHTVKGFSVINEAEIDVFFLEFPCFLYDPTNVDLWFLCLFETQLVLIEVLGSHIAETQLVGF